MPQNPIVPRYGGNNSKLNVTSSAVIKAAPGTYWSAGVTAISGTIGIYDSPTIAGCTASNLIDTISATRSPEVVAFPCKTGITAIIHSSGILEIAFS